MERGFLWQFRMRCGFLGKYNSKMDNKLDRYIDFIGESFHGKAFQLKEITEGLSYDIKVRCRCDGIDYIIKIIEGQNENMVINPRRILWYQALSAVHSENRNILAPAWYGVCNQHIVTRTEWIHGIQLNDLFDKNPELMIPYGEKVGKLLKQLHTSQTIRDSLSRNQVSIARTLASVRQMKEEIIKNGIRFQEMDQAIGYLEENESLLSDSRLGILHNDVRPQNLIAEGDSIYLFDFDSGRISDCYGDFTYLSALSEEKYRPFSKALIHSYFDSDIPDDFWKVNLFFCITKLMDYAIYKYQTKGTGVVRQAENMISQFDHYMRAAPVWWDSDKA